MRYGLSWWYGIIGKVFVKRAVDDADEFQLKDEIMKILYLVVGPVCFLTSNSVAIIASYGSLCCCSAAVVARAVAENGSASVMVVEHGGCEPTKKKLPVLALGNKESNH